MSNNKPPFWHKLVMAPTPVALISTIITLSAQLEAGTAEATNRVRVIGFALSELTMIVAAAGALLYLLTTDKNRLWLAINTLIFFAAGVAGVMLFLAL